MTYIPHSVEFKDICGFESTFTPCPTIDVSCEYEELLWRTKVIVDVEYSGKYVRCDAQIFFTTICFLSYQDIIDNSNLKKVFLVFENEKQKKTFLREYAKLKLKK